MANEKKRAWYWCSRYCRLRDAISYCEEHGIDLGQFTGPEDIIGNCCTCGAVKSWTYMDAGHFKSRGMGGGSGVYFDERNVHLQCKQCNAFKQGAPKEYEEFILDKYGQEVIDELQRKHRVPFNMRSLPMLAMKEFYKGKYKELLKGLK